MFLRHIYKPSHLPGMDQFLLSFFIFFGIFMPKLHAQQSYSGNSVMDCDASNETGPSSAFLYTCNGQKLSCQAFLIFRSQPPYNSVSTISNLTSADPLELAYINNISLSTILPPNKEVIVPVNCSCSGQYYQANTSYIIPSMHDTYFSIANNTYQGLSTCKSLLQENVYGGSSLQAGLVLKVPLRCACPTINQTSNGTKFLLTYVVDWGDTVYDISKRFNSSTISVDDANGIDLDDAVIFPFTTVLVPLSTKPSSSQTIIHFPQPPYSSPFTPINLKRTSRKGPIAWIGIGISLLVLCLLLVVLLHHRKKTREAARKLQLGRKKWELPKDFVVSIDQSLKVYDFEELEVATEDFSHKYKMGGSVYRGVLNGESLAIKKMSKDVDKEVSLLKRINHFNLISLRGACEHSGVFYLVYEFMENGSLKEWLQKKSCQRFHIWNYRIQIALDVANGLHYLHNFTSPAYVHKDICSANVLLDGDLRAKIANFSLARSAEREESRKSLMWSSLGTKGYMAPEYMEYGLVTPEMDIYAFGVLLLELITGKEAVFKQDGKEVLLSEAILTIMKGENADAELDGLLDPSLKGHLWKELARRMVKLSINCLAEEPEIRLSMAEVVSYLLRIQLDAQRSESFSSEWR
ncbi:Serine-threonine protein kinase, plant-type, putative [Theobroma cacao]|uniref:Serine-threonine protein kinase, plant-type, putative n=1 Tax=Theobroma cacao TaxID=3641 RepID=A0A061DG14_THECC|nr:Serine-threonine protein kinase, plant-type, putative [Theobroma cacao]